MTKTEEKHLYNSPGIFTAPNPPPEPLMTVRVKGTPWKMSLVKPLTYHEWLHDKHLEPPPRKWPETEEKYHARLMRTYDRYLRAILTKEGKCVRAFMKATNSKKREKNE